MSLLEIKQELSEDSALDYMPLIHIKHYFIILHFSTINPFPHTAILQQTTLNVFCQNIENLHNWMDNLWQKVENIVAKFSK